MADQKRARALDVRTLFFIFILCFLLLGDEVWAACTVTTTGVTFGNYDALLATPIDTTGTVTITCTRRRNFNYTVVVSIGPGYGNHINPRTMYLTDLLNYNLYTNSTRTTIWGNGTSGTVTQTVHLAGPGGTQASQNLTAYGRIPAGQDVFAGAYTDSLTVTITY